MIRALIFLLLFAAMGQADDFADANATYAAGKYEEARNEYARIVATQPSANAWFNHGNASFRLNEPGRAPLGGAELVNEDAGRKPSPQASYLLGNRGQP